MSASSGRLTPKRSARAGFYALASAEASLAPRTKRAGVAGPKNLHPQARTEAWTDFSGCPANPVPPLDERSISALAGRARYAPRLDEVPAQT